MPEPIVDPNKPSDNPQNTDPNKSANNQDKLPEKFKGKSAEDIANSYLELEKKFSQVSQEHTLTKKQRDDLKALEQFIDNDPESLAFLKQRIQKGKQTPSQQQPIDPRYDQLQEQIVDQKLATQAQIFEKFEGKYGLNQENDDVKDIKHKVGETIKQMVAPKSAKSPTEVMASLPLDVLPMYLENAYKLVTVDNQKEQTRRKTLAQARQNADGMFSSMPSSSLQRNSTTLTAEEKKVAKGLGITDEKYLKQKQAYEAEYQE